MKKPDSTAPTDLRATPRAAATRCPYCHDDVQPEGSVACQDCLGRHHPTCWDENGACASCSGSQLMRAAPRRLDDASVRKMLLDNNYTNQEVDAYLRGEKDHPCHYEKCGNMGSNNDVWVPKRRVCKAHYTKQLIRMMLIFSGFLALLFGLLIAVA